MKKTMKLFMVAFVMMATVSLVACSDDDENPSGQPTESTSYAIHYQDRVLEPGETICHTVTEMERIADEAVEDFFIENKTSSTLSTSFKVEFVEGPDSMRELGVCYGVCIPVTCPYSWSVFQIEPGIDTNPLQLHCYPSDHATGVTGTYRITVGEGSELANPQVFFLQFVL